MIEMEPLPESAEALRRLSTMSGEDLVKQLKMAAHLVVETVPECVAVSFRHFEDDLTFTLVAPSDEFRPLNASQNGRNQATEPRGVSSEGVMPDGIGADDDPWLLFGLTGALHGVRSSLSLPLQRHGKTYGSLDMYAGDEYAFVGRERELAMIFNAVVQEAVHNADLYMATLSASRRATQDLDELEVVDKAVGALMVRKEMSFKQAYRSLMDAADRAGVSPVDLAGLVLRRRAPEV
ncbi:MAG TPA: ANTAR domain-containing protein [Nocardioidaceae bacterium]|nr:ANTAR domain-containing protein [Nocardioidaceae bacterium]